jgi:hypothetical protein
MNREGAWNVVVVACFGLGALLLVVADLAILIPFD